MTDASSLRGRISPWVPFTIGLATSVMTIIAAFLGSDLLIVLYSAATAVFAIWLTFLIATRQADEARHLQGTVDSVEEAVTQIHELLRTVKEEESKLDYANAENDENEEDGERPLYSGEVIAKLQADGFDIDAETAIWRRKQSLPPQVGNHGWFVESPRSSIRWYARKARGLTLRKAMPRDYLDALESLAPLDPRSIKLDFQLKEHGLAAWYARTYSGELWKVWRANRKASAGVQVMRVADMD